MLKPTRQPRDANELAARLVALATGEETLPAPAKDERDPAAVSLGKRGGLKTRQPQESSRFG